MVHVVLEGVVCAGDAIAQWRPVNFRTVSVGMLDPACRRRLYGNSRAAIERLHRQYKQHLREQHGPHIFPILVDNGDSVPELVHEYEVARSTVIASGVYVCAYVFVRVLLHLGAICMGSQQTKLAD